MKMSCYVLVILALVTLAFGVQATVCARTWLVNAGGTGDAPTIQAGIDSAAAADTVLLADGTFTGPGNRDIDFDGKAVTVRSQSGSESLCIIDCQGTSGDPHRGFIFESGETQASVLEYVTVIGGYMDNGGALACYYASPSITGCYFAGNTAASVGGAIDMVSSAAIITNCQFAGNESGSSAGAVYCETLSPTFSLCSFAWNTSGTNGGGLYCHANAPTIIECIFSNNSALRGAGMYLDGGSTASLTYCIFRENSATLLGGGMRCFGASPTLESCTFAADSSGSGGAAVHLGSSDAPGFTTTLIAFAKTGSAIGCDSPGGALGLSCCNIYGNEGGDWTGCIAVHADMNGNFSSDPLFCNMPTSDLRVEGCSPCMAGYNTCGVDIGAQGAGCGCGEATEPATWGKVKAMFR